MIAASTTSRPSQDQNKAAPSMGRWTGEGAEAFSAGTSDICSCHWESTGMVWRWNYTGKPNSRVLPSTFKMWSNPWNSSLLTCCLSSTCPFTSMTFLLHFSKIQELFSSLCKMFSSVLQTWEKKIQKPIACKPGMSFTESCTLCLIAPNLDCFLSEEEVTSSCLNSHHW